MLQLSTELLLLAPLQLQATSPSPFTDAILEADVIACDISAPLTVSSCLGSSTSWSWNRLRQTTHHRWRAGVFQHSESAGRVRDMCGASWPWRGARNHQRGGSRRHILC